MNMVPSALLIKKDPDDIRREENKRLRYMSSPILDMVNKNESTLIPISASAIACDIPTPSRGEVPRPSSSTKTKLFGEASPVMEIFLQSRVYNRWLCERT